MGALDPARPAWWFHTQSCWSPDGVYTGALYCQHSPGRQLREHQTNDKSRRTQLTGKRSRGAALMLGRAGWELAEEPVPHGTPEMCSRGRCTRSTAFTRSTESWAPGKEGRGLQTLARLRGKKIHGPLPRNEGPQTVRTRIFGRWWEPRPVRGLAYMSPKVHVLEAWTPACGFTGRWWNFEQVGPDGRKLDLRAAFSLCTSWILD